MIIVWFFITAIVISPLAFSSPGRYVLSMTDTPLAVACLIIFILSYLAVMAEELLDLRKSKPVLLAAGIIWVLIAVLANNAGISHDKVHEAITHNLAEYAAIFLFLLVAMTYINAMEERNVFEALKSWLINKKFTFKQLFWITGCLAFFISPLADNLTTALLMGSVVMAIGKNCPKFIVIGMVNIVVAANAGGTFSPFGDITTLMVWQAEKVDFIDFFQLFIPSVINFLVPAVVMHWFVPATALNTSEAPVTIKPGGITICLLFLTTIMLAILFEQLLSLPAFMGMMSGLALLMFYAYYLQLCQKKRSRHSGRNTVLELEVFQKIARVEWDTLLFFFGIIFSVGGLGCLGYLALISESMYGTLGHTTANILAGIASAIIDNIPVMFAVLNMDLHMDRFQWLLITLTAGVGGSLLSIGSAAGVALMGISKGAYTFMQHLRWSWIILLGYALSICSHFLVNGL